MKAYISFFLFLSILFQFGNLSVEAQTPKQKKLDCYVGLGAGLDYGGVGTKTEFLPAKFLGVFLGIGYNLVGLAANAGLSFKIMPKRDITPVVLAMYGYNGAIRSKIMTINGPSVFRKTYKGLTFGVGSEFDIGKSLKNKISVIILGPIRDREYYEDMQNYVPLTLSVGFNWGF